MRILKLSMVKIALSVFPIALTAPYAVFAVQQQTQQEERITINVQNVTVKDFIGKIGKLTRLEMVFASDDLNKKQRITYRADNRPLSKVLDETLRPLGLDFKIENGIISIFQQASAAMPASSAPTSPSKPTKYLNGQVLDAKTGKPLTGASLSTPSSQSMAVSGENGAFTIPVEATESSMSASFVGYIPSEVSILGKSTVAIYLTPATTNLDDVVVTGMFTRKLSTYTGAVRTLKSEELERTGTLNVIEAIARLDPSFQILINDISGSNPNALPDIQMRGAASFSDMKARYTSSPNQPLFIIDGFEQPIERVFDMDMNRIKNITLLKDATAKAIYGSKGANGVVVIETKRPAQGQLRVSYKADLNVQSPVLSDYNLANAAEKLEVERLAGMYSSPYPDQQLDLDRKYHAIQQDILQGVNTDWLAQPTRVGIGQKHAVNLEGGDERMLYNMNISYNNIAGVMKGSSRKTVEGGFGLQYRYRNFVFREQLSIISNQANESPYGSFEDYARMNPYWRMKDDRGNLIPILGVYGRYRATDIDGDGVPDREFPIYNPMLNAGTNYLNRQRYLDITNNFLTEWNIRHDLRFTARIGVTNRASNGDLFYPSSYATLEPGSPLNFRAVKPDAANDAYYKRGLYTRSADNRFSLSSNIGLSYSKTIGKHLVFLNGQYTVSEDKSKMESFKGQGFADNATSITQAKQYMENDKPAGNDRKVREMGMVGSVNYSYDNRYLVDANYRANASSLFGANKRWGHFWSVGAGWNLHEEAFMKPIKAISNLKVRGSYGYTGAQNFESYLSLATYSYFNDRVYDDVIGAYLLALSNPDLKWQQTLDKNIGFNISVLKRIDLTFDYYTKTTSDLLTPITVVSSTGFDSYTENLGKSENKGIEIGLSVLVLSDRKKDLQLSVFGNLAHNKNKLLKIGDALKSINDEIDKGQGDVDPNPENRARNRPRVEYEEGQSLSAIWGVPSLGIDPFNGQEVFLRKDGSRTYTWSAEDKVVLGDALPKVQGAFGFNLDYRGVSVSTNFGYRTGGQYYNQTLVNQVENADLQYNVDRRVFTERWNPETPGVPAKYKGLARNVPPTMPSSRFIQDYNELKLSTLNVGYDFRNAAFIRRGKPVERLRATFAMNDLLRFATVKAERGISYPYARSFICSVNASF